HVLRGLAQVDDPLAECRRPDAVGHVLRVDRAGGVVVTADAADAAGDEVGVARVLALHEDAVAAEDRGAAVALRDSLSLEVDLGVDAQAAHDPGDRVPGHLHQLAIPGGAAPGGVVLGGGHRVALRSVTRCSCSRSAGCCPWSATWAPRPRSAG